jgi:hypothetical protein
MKIQSLLCVYYGLCGSNYAIVLRGSPLSKPPQMQKYSQNLDFNSPYAREVVFRLKS